MIGPKNVPYYHYKTILDIILIYKVKQVATEQTFKEDLAKLKKMCNYHNIQITERSKSMEQH